ncbi:MAG: glycosyltransferase family 2 protein [Planctomycetota bacterium]
MQARPFISVLITVYNERPSLLELTHRIEAVFHDQKMKGRFELIFVDDGSTDGTAEQLHAMADEKEFLRAIILRANGGKSLALTAGFRAARGEYVITMDGDLQDCPEDIPRLLEKARQGFDVVVGRRQRRNDGFIRKRGSQAFNRTVAAWTGLHLHDMNCGFKILHRDAAKHLLVFGHLHRYLAVLAHLAGFRVTETFVENHKRRYGRSRYPAFRLQGLSDLFSILFIHKHRFNPHHFFGIAGVSLIVPGIVLLLCLVLRLMGSAGSTGMTPLSNPYMLLAASLLLLGGQAILIGFACDFFLHHSVRRNVVEWIDDNIREIVPENRSPWQSHENRKTGKHKEKQEKVPTF